MAHALPCGCESDGSILCGAHAPKRGTFFEPDTDRERAERKGNQPLRATVPQRFDLGGLPIFDQDARPQSQLFDALEGRKP